MKRNLRGASVTVVMVISIVTLINGGCDREHGSGQTAESAKKTFSSNGERIYFTATSNSGQRISAIGGMMVHAEITSCADCHGEDGRGREVRMMMHSFTAPDIRYDSLTSTHHHEEEAEDDHSVEGEEPPYTDETIKEAITKGLDPSRKRLDPIMPRWNMSGADLEDLLDYLKSLK